jgi:hypothetical protein
MSMKNFAKFLAVAIIIGTASFGISSCTRGGVHGPSGGASNVQQQQQAQPMGNRTAPTATEKEKKQPGIEKQAVQPTKGKEKTGGAAGVKQPVTKTTTQKSCPATTAAKKKTGKTIAHKKTAMKKTGAAAGVTSKPVCACKKKAATGGAAKVKHHKHYRTHAIAPRHYKTGAAASVRHHRAKCTCPCPCKRYKTGAAAGIKHKKHHHIKKEVCPVRKNNTGSASSTNPSAGTSSSTTGTNKY